MMTMNVDKSAVYKSSYSAQRRIPEFVIMLQCTGLFHYIIFISAVREF